MSIGFALFFVSATPAGILELLKRYHIETQGKHCVVFGTQQYCRQADGYLDDAEILSGRLYGDRMP